MAYQSKYTGLQIDDILDSVEWKEGKIEDLEQIRAGAQKGATALQSYTEKYTGTVTGIKINGETKSGSGVIDLGTISTDISGKVDKVAGKQLSTEDFTTALKTKLEGLNNYDDTELSEAIETLRGDFDNIVSGDTTTAIKTFNEVIAFLDGLTDTQDLESIIASIEQQIAGKADNNSVVHIAGAETITGVKTFNGRVNFLGSGDSNAMYLSTNTRLNVDGTTNTVLGFSSGTFLINNAAYNLTLRGKGTRPTYNSTTLALSSDIPAAVTESTVSGWGFTKNTGTYSKPSGGIPKTDLASAVQTSLGKADTALQSYTEQYKGTITGVSANGTSVATSGVANIPAASTSAYGVTKLSSATNSTSTTLAATASAVKAAYDLANGKQAKLVSGTNIKTINGTSILGSGNIEISGGSKTYVFDWGMGDVYSGTISAEEFAEMLAADSILVDRNQGVIRQEADSVIKVGTSECSFTIHTYASNWIDGVYFVFENYGSSGVSWTATQSTSTIPTKTSELTNDSNFISSTNIKTINGESILGSGDITISGGSSSSGSGAYSEVNHGTSDTTFTLTPNTFHIWDEVANLTLTLGSETSGVANEYLFQFTSGSTATSLTLPDNIKWVNDSAPAISKNMIYQISVLKGLASCLEFDNTPNITLINFIVDNDSFNAEAGMLWSEWAVSSYNTSGYISINQNKVTHAYTSNNLFTTGGVTVNSSDIVQPIKYTFTNPWA